MYDAGAFEISKIGCEALGTSQEKMLTIGDRVKKLMEGMTGRGFSKRLGLPNNTVSNYVTGKRTISVEFIVLICRHFDVDPWWLMTGEEKGVSVKVAELSEPCQPKPLPQDEQYLLAAYRNLNESDKAAIAAVISAMAAIPSCIKTSRLP